MTVIAVTWRLTRRCSGSHGSSRSSGSGSDGCIPSAFASNFSVALPARLTFLSCLRYRCKLYLCPSQSTQDMLASHSLPHSRPWSRGVDLSHFNPSRRSALLRAQWGIKTLELAEEPSKGFALPPRSIQVGGLATPPMSPEFGAADATTAPALEFKETRLAVLYVGRV